MKNWYYIKLLFILTAYSTSTSFSGVTAQEVIGSSSGYYETPAMSVSWTLGETVVETLANDNIILTQGFNQGNLSITDISDNLLADFNMSVYPNPAKDIVNLKTTGGNPGQLKAEIYDFSGSKVFSSETFYGNTQINIERLPASEYILRVFDRQNVIKSFRIIKIK